MHKRAMNAHQEVELQRMRRDSLHVADLQTGSQKTIQAAQQHCSHP